MVEQVAQMIVHGEAWTIKDLFVLPNEYVYWSIQIVMYPYMTGLVAGAFVLSSLYHVFNVEKLKEIARYALVFSFALLPVAMMPLMLHLSQPFRGIHVLMTPHFTSAISAFGIVFMTYACIVAAEIWFVYRKFIVESVHRLNNKQDRSGLESLLLPIYKVISLERWTSPKKPSIPTTRQSSSWQRLAFRLPASCMAMPDLFSAQ